MNENAGTETQGFEESEIESDRGIAGGTCYWVGPTEQVLSVQLK